MSFPGWEDQQKFDMCMLHMPMAMLLLDVKMTWTNQHFWKYCWSCEANIIEYEPNTNWNTFRAVGCKSQIAQLEVICGIYDELPPLCVRGVFYSFQPATLVYQKGHGFHHMFLPKKQTHAFPFFWRRHKCPREARLPGESYRWFLLHLLNSGWENSFFWVGF